MVELRPWPKDAGVAKGTSKRFFAAYRKAFDADPGAKFCAGEIDGVTVVVAVGEAGEKLQWFVENTLYGVIQRDPKLARGVSE